MVVLLTCDYFKELLEPSSSWSCWCCLSGWSVFAPPGPRSRRRLDWALELRLLTREATTSTTAGEPPMLRASPPATTAPTPTTTMTRRTAGTCPTSTARDTWRSVAQINKPALDIKCWFRRMVWPGRWTAWPAPMPASTATRRSSMTDSGATPTRAARKVSWFDHLLDSVWSGIRMIWLSVTLLQRRVPTRPPAILMTVATLRRSHKMME